MILPKSQYPDLSSMLNNLADPIPGSSRHAYPLRQGTTPTKFNYLASAYDRRPDNSILKLNFSFFVLSRPYQFNVSQTALRCKRGSSILLIGTDHDCAIIIYLIGIDRM